MQVLLSTYLQPPQIYNKSKFKQHSSLIIRDKSDTISFKGKPRPVILDELMKKIIGINSFEDVVKIKTIANAILKKVAGSQEEKSIVEYEGNYYASLQSVLCANGINPQNMRGETRYLDNFATLSKRTKKQIKKLYMNIQAARMAKVMSNHAEKTLYNPVINDWFKNVEYKSPIPNIFLSIYAHPIDKAKYLIGMFSKEQQFLIDKKVQKFLKKKLSSKDILKLKYDTSKKVQSYFNFESFIKNGELKNIDITKLNELILRYEALHRISNSQTPAKALESVVLNSGKKLSSAQIGDYITDLGLIIDKTEIYDTQKQINIPCVVLFDKMKTGQGLRIVKVNKELEENAEKLNKQYEELINSNERTSKNPKNDNFSASSATNNEFAAQIGILNNQAQNIIAEEQNDLISQVKFEIKPPEYLNTFFYNVPNKDQIEILKPDSIQASKNGETPKIKQITTILSLINSNPQRYYNAGRNLAMYLMAILKENNLKDVFLVAHAIGEKANSPVPLYLRAGFKAIYPDENEIRQEISHKHWDSKKSVYMYLPPNALINKMVEKANPLKEFTER